MATFLLDMLASWIVLSVAIPLFIGLGVGVMSLAPPEFVFAKCCFSIAALLLIRPVAIWLMSVDFPSLGRIGVGFLIFGAVGSLWLESIRWVTEREIKARFGEIQDTSYRDLVAEVMQSLDPAAHVVVGNAIDGPDGFRKVDVEMRLSDNTLTAVDVISHPDGRKVSVESVDQADSKRKDIKADTMIICSNTGFDELAIRKAKRRHIGLIAVVKQGDQRASAIIQEEIYLRKVQVPFLTLTWIGATNADGELLRKHFKNAHDMTFDGGSVASWLALKAADIIMFNPTLQGPFTTTFHLKSPTKFSLQGHSVTLQAITIEFHPHVQWLSQVMEVNAESAIYNYVRGHLTLSPGPNAVAMKPVDFETATPMASPPPETDLGFGLLPFLPGELEIKLVVVEGLDIPVGAESTVPELDDLIRPEDLLLSITVPPPENTP